MVTQIVPDDRLEAEVASLTQRLASCPATAMRATKALLNDAAYPDFDAQLAKEVAMSPNVSPPMTLPRAVKRCLRVNGRNSPEPAKTGHESATIDR